MECVLYKVSRVIQLKNINVKGSLLVLVLLPVLVILLVVTKPSAEQPLKETVPARVKTTIVQTMDIHPSYVVTGKLQSHKKVNLRAEVTGKLIERYVDAGEFVEQGSILLSIDDQDLID